MNGSRSGSNEAGKPIQGEELIGRLTTGVGQGTHFTQIDWARRQFTEKLGLDPFPGTANLIIEDAKSLSVWSRLKGTPGVRIDNPNKGPHDCDARCYPVSIEGRIEAAIVLPEVTGYSPVEIELIAAVGIRTTLGIDDGDSVRLEIEQLRA
jgi:CTP-dependent riboflavin kinase